MKQTFLFLSLILITSSFAITSQALENELTIIDQLITNDEGVFLKVGNEWLATDGLQASESGILILINGGWITIEEAFESLGGERREKWKCTKCGFFNYDGIAACAVCGKPRHG